MTEPYLRPAPPEGSPSLSCPPGRQAQPAGLWHGKAMEVVYDPRCHDVVFVLGGITPGVQGALEASGWDRRLTDGPNEMWIRDRSAIARRRLGTHLIRHDAPRIA